MQTVKHRCSILLPFTAAMSVGDFMHIYRSTRSSAFANARALTAFDVGMEVTFTVQDFQPYAYSHRHVESEPSQNHVSTCSLTMLALHT